MKPIIFFICMGEMGEVRRGEVRLRLGYLFCEVIFDLVMYFSLTSSFKCVCVCVCVCVCTRWTILNSHILTHTHTV